MTDFYDHDKNTHRNSHFSNLTVIEEYTVALFVDNSSDAFMTRITATKTVIFMFKDMLMPQVPQVLYGN